MTIGQQNRTEHKAIFSGTGVLIQYISNRQALANGLKKNCSRVCSKINSFVFKLSCIECVVVMLFIFYSTEGLAAELDTFRLTGLEGSLELGYSVEDLEVKRVDGSTMTQRRPVSEQKLEVETKGYVYHPNLVELNLGVGVEFKREDMETESVSSESKQTRYSFNGDLDILKEKPYPVRIFYNQYNPTSSVGLADSVTYENRDYGMSLSLREPLVSFPVFFRANHSESKGEGSGTSIDSDYDYQDIRVVTSGFDKVTAHLTIDHSTKRSGSGSVNLPLQSTVNEKYGIDFGSKVNFGESKRHTLFNKLSYDTDEFKGLSKTEDARFYTSLNLQHGDSFKTHYRYNIDKTKDKDLETESTNDNLTVGLLSDITESLSFTGDLESANEETHGFNRNTKGVRSFFRYKTDLSEQTTVNTSYMLRYAHNEQVSDVTQVLARSESHQLDNFQTVVLNNNYVVSETVVVSNQDRTQTYVEGVDYLLIEVGAETRIERLLSGNIANGMIVLVDYGYEAGGTFTYSLIKQALTAGFTLYKNYRFNIGYSKQEESLKDGRALRPLYTTETAFTTADARYRLSQTMNMSWRLALEKEYSELRPFLRKEADINFSTMLPFLSSFTNIHARYENIDNELSDEDVNLTLYGVSLFLRTGFRSRASVKFSIENDSGGTISREVKRYELDYMWRWRLLSFRLNGEYNLEEQGEASRQDTSIYLTLVRQF